MRLRNLFWKRYTIIYTAIKCKGASLPEKVWRNRKRQLGNRVAHSSVCAYFRKKKENPRDRQHATPDRFFYSLIPPRRKRGSEFQRRYNGVTYIAPHFARFIFAGDDNHTTKSSQSSSKIQPWQFHF